MSTILYVGNFLGDHKGFYSGPNKWIVENLNNNNYNVLFASKRKKKISRLKDIYCLISNNKKHAEIVFIDTYSSQAFYFALFTSLLCIIYGIKYIPILHGGDLPARYLKTPNLAKFIFKRAQMIVAPSEYLQIKTIESFNIKPVIIRNPIQTELYEFKQREVQKPLLLWVRSFQEVYNPKMAIDVIEILNKNNYYAKLYFVGPDKSNMLTEIHSYIKEKKLEGNVVVKGKMTLNEWTKLSEECNVFINTTHKDNTPVSVLEAMALGLPVVTTSVGGIPYLISENVDALCCNDGDAEEMAQKVQSLVGNFEKVNSLTTNARKKVLECYDASMVLKSWLDLLKKIQIEANHHTLN